MMKQTKRNSILGIFFSPSKSQLDVEVDLKRQMKLRLPGLERYVNPFSSIRFSAPFWGLEICN